MASGFIDSLKLVLSDKYDISDSDYKTLSDILISNGLSDRAFDSGLVEMIYLMIKYHHRFPISITFLRELWEYENVSFNFVKMVGDLMKNGVVSLRKVKRDTFFKSSNITKSNSEDLDRDIYVVAYGSELFNSVFSSFEEILNKKISVHESVSMLPKKYSDIVDRASRLLKTIGAKIEIESFIGDSALGISRLNMIISDTSKYSIKDKDVQRIAKKNIKGSFVSDVESYKESDSEIFLGIDLDSKEVSYRGLSDSIYAFIEELEVKGV